MYSTTIVSSTFMDRVGNDPVMPVGIGGNRKVAVDCCAIARLERPANTSKPAENAVDPTILSVVSVMTVE